MTVDELQIILGNLGIPERSYSINANLKSDIHVLRKISDVWEYFYVDERGGQDNDHRFFKTEDEASRYLLKVLIEER